MYSQLQAQNVRGPDSENIHMSQSDYRINLFATVISLSDMNSKNKIHHIIIFENASL